MFKTLRNWWKIRQIAPVELQAWLSRGDSVQLLDVRHVEEYDYHGHIRQAILMPLATLSETYHTLTLDLPIVCVDRAGQRSQKACELLLDYGFIEVLNLAGGMQAWRKAGLPIER